MDVRIDVLQSCIWQTNSTILSRAGACLVVDPAYFPREVDAVAARVADLGRAEAVVFTHGHWDHIMGHAAFPDAPVLVGRGLADAIAADRPRAARLLQDARDFDSRWYVERPSGHRWPVALRGVSDGDAIVLGGAAVQAFHLPGHSPDDLGLLVDGLLLVGDYLSPCEIPFVEDAEAYRATLARLVGLLAGAREVIPGHGSRLTRDEAIAIARADIDYVDRLLAARAEGDAAAARAIALPRAAGVAGMRDHHRENCANLGLALA